MNRPAHIDQSGHRETHTMCARCGRRPVVAPGAVCAGCAAPAGDAAPSGAGRPEQMERRGVRD